MYDNFVIFAYLLPALHNYRQARCGLYLTGSEKGVLAGSCKQRSRTIFRETKHDTKLMMTHFNLLTYFINPWSRVILEKLTVHKLVMKSPTFYGTRRFTPDFTTTCHLSLSWARSIQSKPPYRISYRSMLLSSHLHLAFLSDLFPTGLSIKILHVTLPPRFRHRPSHSYWRSHSNNINA